MRVESTEWPDNKKISERLVKKYKANRIGVVVDDYDDFELLEMKNIEFVMCSVEKEKSKDL